MHSAVISSSKQIVKTKKKRRPSNTDLDRRKAVVEHSESVPANQERVLRQRKWRRNVRYAFDIDDYPGDDEYFIEDIDGDERGRADLDGNQIKPITICMIGAGGFIDSHLCEKLISETPHKVLAVDVYNDKIKHLLEPATLAWADRIGEEYFDIRHDIFKKRINSHGSVIEVKQDGTGAPKIERPLQRHGGSIVTSFNHSNNVDYICRAH